VIENEASVFAIVYHHPFKAGAVSRSRICVRAAIVPLLQALALLSLSAQTSLDYPQWRGVDRDGAAAGFIEPSPWPKAGTVADRRHELIANETGPGNV
jgi:hypothetical protein